MKWLLIILAYTTSGADLDRVVYIDKEVCERAAAVLNSEPVFGAVCVPYDGDEK